MSEHDDRYARTDLPRTTGEFRAAQDVSASTAEFKAFAAGRDPEDAKRGSGGLWPEQPWSGGQAQNTGSRRNVIIIAAVVVAILVIIGVIIAIG